MTFMIIREIGMIKKFICFPKVVHTTYKTKSCIRHICMIDDLYVFCIHRVITRRRRWFFDTKIGINYASIFVSNVRTKVSSLFVCYKTTKMHFLCTQLTSDTNSLSRLKQFCRLMSTNLHFLWFENDQINADIGIKVSSKNTRSRITMNLFDNILTMEKYFQ